MVVSDVLSSILSPVSISIALTMYCLIIPFFCSEGGGSQFRERLVELMAVPVRFWGGASGSVKVKIMQTSVNSISKTYHPLAKEFISITNTYHPPATKPILRC